MDIYDFTGIFLFPSLFEGFGKAPLEAMTRGLCVVSSRMGGMADIITHGHDGILVEPGDTRALVDSVNTLLDNPSMAECMARAARKTALGYTWGRAGREISEWLQKLIRNPTND